MIQYTVANHLIQVSGKGLNHIPGFSQFLSKESSGKSILQLQLGTMLADWNIEPLQTFPFEDDNVMCDFTFNNSIYYFRMKKEKEVFLMEITNQNGLFSATTNMDENTPSHLLRFAVWMAFNIACVHHQTVAFHASTISCEDRSILFLGESGTGKSTHTRLWLNNIPDTELLNDDSPFIRVKGNEVFVFGSPWSGKTPCYKNKNTPVAAIVRLSQAPYNKITQLKGISALGALLPSCPPAFAYDETLFSHISEILSVILQQIPVYSLECLPDPDAAYLVFRTLKESGRL